MSSIAVITIRLHLDTEVTPEIKAALDALADVAFVQTEDGLYSGGYEDAEPEDGENVFLTDFAARAVSVEVFG